MLCLMCLVQDKNESLQERLDALLSGDKSAVDSLDVPDGSGKAKRCR